MFIASHDGQDIHTTFPGNPIPMGHLDGRDNLDLGGMVWYGTSKVLPRRGKGGGAPPSHHHQKKQQQKTQTKKKKKKKKKKKGGKKEGKKPPDTISEHLEFKIFLGGHALRPPYIGGLCLHPPPPPPSSDFLRRTLGTSQAIPSHPDGSFGHLDGRDSWDLGGMVWDIPGNPIPS